MKIVYLSICTNNIQITKKIIRIVAGFRCIFTKSFLFYLPKVHSHSDDDLSRFCIVP